MESEPALRMVSLSAPPTNKVANVMRGLDNQQQKSAMELTTIVMVRWILAAIVKMEPLQHAAVMLASAAPGSNSAPTDNGEPAPEVFSRPHKKCVGIT